jgi:hypothetical protein
MTTRSRLFISALSLAILCGFAGSGFAADNAKAGLWTDANDPSLPVDFKLQGEYAGKTLGCQVIALGNGALHAVLYPGGLPGAGWNGKAKHLMVGKVDGEKAVFTPAAGKKRYLAPKPEEFSAVAGFPPEGHKPYSAVIVDGFLTVKAESGDTTLLKKTVRVSETMGVKPPAGAIVLFDGTATDSWTGGRLDKTTKWLNTDGKDILTKEKFSDYTMHIEFMLPYRPRARGQGRGNSGFYQVDHYEMQILDSFGLEGRNNECGGIYTKAEPLVNMCLPPLTWQTYDVEFTNAVADDTGKKLKSPILTARHNGVLIHDKLSIIGKTGGSRDDPEGTPGPIKLQGHGNPLQFRNVWIVPKK